MKITIDREEWYPVYTIDREPSKREKPIEVPDEIVERWERIEVEFHKVQDEIVDYFTRSNLLGG